MSKVYNDKRNYLENRLKFQNLSKDANAIIREFGVALNFKGFVETMVDYMKTDDMTPITELEDLIRDLNCWVHYLGEIKTIIFYYKNHFETQGDATSDEQKKIEYKNKFFILKKYEMALQKQETLFSKAYKDLAYQYQERTKKYMRVTGDE